MPRLYSLEALTANTGELTINASVLIVSEIRIERLKCLAEPSVRFMLRKREISCVAIKLI